MKPIQGLLWAKETRVLKIVPTDPESGTIYQPVCQWDLHLCAHRNCFLLLLFLCAQSPNTFSLNDLTHSITSLKTTNLIITAVKPQISQEQTTVLEGTQL